MLVADAKVDRFDRVMIFVGKDAARWWCNKANLGSFII